jgi:pyruvate/2-oxoglutarate dehydrogenase complex dihydrolipoamide dehydrogenase (E3) component
MEAARVCAEKGHSVTLFEKTKELAGGQIRLASSAPGKDEFLNIVNYYKGQFVKNKKVKVVVGKEATLADIKRIKPDAVILATGASPMIPSVDGIDGDNVVSLHDVMSGEVKVKGKVAIAGGGCAGIDCANFLTSQEIDVTVVEMANECALDEELITRLTLLHVLSQRENLTLLTGHTIQEITKEGVTAKDAKGKDVKIPADTVVNAMGFAAHNPLEEAVKKSFKECYVVGDARQPAKIMEAVAGGFFAAQEI